MDKLAQDLRYAMRTFRRSPGFTITSIFCMALAIGGATALFNVINAVVLRDLPVKDPAQLVLLHVTRKLSGASGRSEDPLSYPAFVSMQENARTLAALFAFVPLSFGKDGVSTRIGNQTGTANGEMVTAGYFSGLGVTPALGRTIDHEDEKPGAENVAVISHSYWIRQFNGDADAVGAKILLNGEPHTVIGVAAKGFTGTDAKLTPDFWIPLRDDPRLPPFGVHADPGKSPFRDPSWNWVVAGARRKAGVSDAQAEAELTILLRQNLAAIGRSDAVAGSPEIAFDSLAKGQNSLRNRMSKSLEILLAAVALVLIVGCANVASLLLARAAGRTKEIGVRLALGASRRRVIRQLLTESVALSMLGGLLGVLLAEFSSAPLLRLLAGHASKVDVSTAPDWRVLLACSSLSFLAGVCFGLAPAFRATRISLASRLRGATIAERCQSGKLLVAAQIAVSLVLLTTAGLFWRTIRNLDAVDLGFDRQDLWVFTLNPQQAGYAPDQLPGLCQRALERLRAVPGVRAGSASQMALMAGWVNNGPAATDAPRPPAVPKSGVKWNAVSSDFLAAMDIRLLAGREIRDADFDARRRVAVVSESMAHTYFGAVSPLGHRFSLGTRFDPETSYEIVGLIQDAKYASARDNSMELALVPMTAAPADPFGSISFELRLSGSAAAVIPSVRAAVREVDPNLAVSNLRTEVQQINESMEHERTFAVLSGTLGGLALLLVLAGLYGTLAHLTGRRTREIGLRMALGAPGDRVLRMVLRECWAVVAAGVAAGVPLVYALTRFVSSQLYGVKPDDFATLACAITLLGAAGTLAGYLPARRASRIDPAVALRND